VGGGAPWILGVAAKRKILHVPGIRHFPVHFAECPWREMGYVFWHR